MKNNIIDVYYERRKNNIAGYTKTIMKSVFEKSRIRSELYLNIVEKYVDDNNWRFIKLTPKTSDFMNRNNITHYKIKTILNYVITYMEDLKIKNNLDENKDELLAIANSLFVAVEMDNRTNVLLHEQVTYAKVIKNVIIEYEKIFNEEFVEKLKLIEKELKEQMKNNIQTDKAFFRTLKNNNFNLTYLEIASLDECDYYDVKFNYQINALNKFMARDINDQIITKGLNNKFTIITAEMLSITILKLLYKRKKAKIFLIEIPENFFESMDNINDIVAKLSNPKIKERVCFKIKYSLLVKNKDRIIKLVNAGFQIATCEMKNISEKRDGANFRKMIDLLIEDEKFINENVLSISDFMKKTDTKLIKDHSIQNKSITEQELLEK